jgi:hypothetical protein
VKETKTRLAAAVAPKGHSLAAAAKLQLPVAQTQRKFAGKHLASRSEYPTMLRHG